MLGKGLESLIPPQGKPREDGRPAPAAQPSKPAEPDQKSSVRVERQPKHTQAVFQIETSKIKPNPHQPRREFDEGALKELSVSIREFGIIQPLVVTKLELETPAGADVEYILIAGERRLLAAKLAGLERVPAIVRNVSLDRERLELAIIENLQREDLNPIEKARAFSRLQDDFRLTQREIASRLGKSREAIANTMRLLDLPSFIQDALSKGMLSESHGRLLLAVADPQAQEKIFRDLVDKHITVRELKERVERSKGEGRREAEALPPELKMVRERLSEELGAPVDISRSGESGKIVITFYSPEELDNIVSKLSGRAE